MGEQGVSPWGRGGTKLEPGRGLPHPSCCQLPLSALLRALLTPPPTPNTPPHCPEMSVTPSVCPCRFRESRGDGSGEGNA